MINFNSVILFYSNKDEKSYKHCEYYALGTGYCLLYNNENDCIICRILDDNEIYSFSKSAVHQLFFGKVEKENELTEKNVLIVISKSIDIITARKQLNNSMLFF